MLAAFGKFLYGAAVLAIAGGLLCAFLGERRPLTPYMGYLLSLTLVLMLLSPLLQVVGALHMSLPELSASDSAWPDISDAALLYERSTVAYAKEQAQAALRELLVYKTGVPAEAMQLFITFTGENPRTLCVVSAEILVLDRKYRLMTDKLRACAEAALACPCTVSFSEEP